MNRPAGTQLTITTGPSTTTNRLQFALDRAADAIFWQGRCDAVLIERVKVGDNYPLELGLGRYEYYVTQVKVENEDKEIA